MLPLDRLRSSEINDSKKSLILSMRGAGGMGFEITRRMVVGAGTSAALLGISSGLSGQQSSGAEFVLENDVRLGELGEYDANYLGPPASKEARGPFVFPADAESHSAYGIDISHWSGEIPWSLLSGANVNYVYIKASQAARARDGMFETHWKAAKLHRVPRGAYHWLTPGIAGREQGEYFVSRIKAAGGLERGDMQPVIDLEWDYLGKDFRKLLLSGGGFKDFWSDHASAGIATEMNACIAAVKAGFSGLDVRPVIYTNRSWWDQRIAPHVRFDAPVWLADYRQKSYAAGVPRAIAGHDYNLWQFTEKGSISADGRRFGPFDCNKIVKGDLQALLVT